MQPVTLVYAIVVSILVVVLRPAYALAAYIGAVVWYPDYLRVSLGTIDISVSRIVITILLMRRMFDSRTASKFSWCKLDTWVVASALIWTSVYCLASQDAAVAFENRGGFIIDTLFVYFAARLTITDKQSILSFSKAVALFIAPLAVLGIFEAITHVQPYAALRQFRPWRQIDTETVAIARARWGLARALGPFDHSIMFGSVFATFCPLIWALRRGRGSWRVWAYAFSIVFIAGTLSSMSSCSWVMMGAVLFCLGLEKHPYLVRPLLWVMGVGYVLGEVASNRPMYRVIAGLVNVLGGDWWQRTVLMEEAINHFGEWCWFGYGNADPGWGVRTGADFTDVNNQFILVAIQSGLIGLLVFCTVLGLAIRHAVRSYRKTTDPEMRSLYWAFGTIMVATIVVWMGVSYFGQPFMLFYSVLGVMESTSALADKAVLAPARYGLSASPALGARA